MEMKKESLKPLEYPRCCVLQTVELASNKNRLKYRLSFKTNESLKPNLMSEHSDEPLREHVKDKKVKLASQPSLYKIKKPARF